MDKIKEKDMESVEKMEIRTIYIDKLETVLDMNGIVGF